MPRRLSDSIHVPLPPDAAFDLLLRPSAVRQWWSARSVIVVPRDGGAWAAAWGDDEDAPEYVTVACIAEIARPRVLVLDRYTYAAKHGDLPFQADFVVRFEIQPDGAGCQLHVEQCGFPDDAAADARLSACQRGWRETLGSIARHAARAAGGRA